jgi:hypothetical protein
VQSISTYLADREAFGALEEARPRADHGLVSGVRIVLAGDDEIRVQARFEKTIGVLALGMIAAVQKSTS